LRHIRLLALLVIITVAAAPLAHTGTHAASSGFTEKLTAYVAGSDAAWFLDLEGVNVSNAYVSSAESVPGVSGYNLTAVKSTAWVSDYQIFGPQGYNVLPVPFVPPEGVFLTVGAVSYAAASSAATRLGSYLLTNFESTTNESGLFSFFAPISFGKVMPSTLLKLLPTSTAGFVKAITVSSFLGLDSPVVALEGKRGESGFVHDLILGSITSTGLDSTSKPNLLSYFGQAQASLRASNKSLSSTIIFHFLDGLATSPDSARVTNDQAAFSSTYVLSVKPGAVIHKLNATVIQQPAVLLATRVIDLGVLKTGANMSVTISLTNLSNSTAVSGIIVSDDWWKASGLFKLVGGNSTISVPSLSIGDASNPTYVLRYTGNRTQQMQLPATSVTYVYSFGTLALQRHTNLNPISISLGADEPVLYASLAPVGSLIRPVGSAQGLKVLVKNVGTRAASSVSVGGQDVGGLPASGGSATVTLRPSSPRLASSNVTQTYQVSYKTPEGQSVNVATNPLEVIFSHKSMNIGFGVLSLNSTVSQLPSGNGSNLNLTLAFSNKGTANVTSVTARALLPAGLSCGKVSSSLTCENGVLTLSHSNLAPQGQMKASASFNISQPRSFTFPPASYHLQSSGYSIAGFSNALPVPTGFALSKHFGLTQLFGGQSTQVTTLALNAGPKVIYNLTVKSPADPFDTVLGGGSPGQFRANLTVGANLSLSYGVSVGSAPGSGISSPATANFFFGGVPFTRSEPGPKVSIYSPIGATIASSPPTPTEGRQFDILISLTNPSAVSVNDVKFLLPVPSGVAIAGASNASVVNGGVSISLSQLTAGGSYRAKVTATASSGQTIPFNKAKLTFSYANATLNGRLPSTGIAISEDVTVRYLLPIGFVLLALIATAVEVRRMAGVTSRAAQP